MNLPLPLDRWDIELLTEERTAAVGGFGFTPRQARFLVEVLIHSGVFVERQYCQFAGLTHGQKTTDFLRRLVERGYARPIATGAPHRGRLFHVHHKPLYAAIGQADNRHRKPGDGPHIERLMLTRAGADRTFTVSTEFDKRRYSSATFGRVEAHPAPEFGQGAEATHRYFPDSCRSACRDRPIMLLTVTSSGLMDSGCSASALELFRPLSADDSRARASAVCPGDSRFDTWRGRRRNASRTRTARVSNGSFGSDSAVRNLLCNLPTTVSGQLQWRTARRAFEPCFGCGSRRVTPPFGPPNRSPCATPSNVARGASNSSS
jgi:hypothetical protein